MKTTPLINFEGIRLGTAIVTSGIGLYPILRDAEVGQGIDLADDLLEVSELAEASVPTLEVYNPKDRPVLIPAGKILSGGRQTRTVNVTIVVGPRTRMPIPVSCVEAGRWHGGTRFSDSKRTLSRRVRVAKQASVAYGLSSQRGARYSDQGAVWSAIDEELASRSISHDSSLYLEADEDLERSPHTRRALEDLESRRPEAGQVGIAVAVGRRVTGVEIFPSEAALRESWQGLVRAAVIEAPSLAVEDVAGPAAVEDFLRRVAAAPATIADGVGLGREYHVSTPDFVAHALQLDGETLYANAFATA